MAYSAGPTPMKPLSRVKGIATATMILSAIAGVSAIITAITTPAAADGAKDFLAGRISEEQFLDDYTAFGLTQSLQSIGTVATAVLTMIWLYRVASNVRSFGRATTWAPIWAVFAWILPPVLIIIPFLMVREVWKASDPAAPHDPHGWKQSAENPMIWLWLVAYGIVPTIITALSFQAVFGAGLSRDAETLAEALDDSGTIQMIGAGVTVIAAIAWILVVRQVTARHIELTNER